MLPTGDEGYTVFFIGDVVDGDCVVSIALVVSAGAEALPADAQADLEQFHLDLLTNAYEYQDGVLG